MEREVDRCRRRVGQLGLRWHFEGHGARADGELRVAAEGTARYGDHPLADPVLGAGSGALDRAEHLHAGGVGEGWAHRAVATAHAVDVVEVERRGRDSHEQFAGAGRGRRHLVEP